MQERILFGTDSVITRTRYKTAAYLASTFRAYRHMLELDEYAIDIVGKDGKLWEATLRGLSLPESVLRRIYRDNFDRFLERTSKTASHGPSSPRRSQLPAGRTDGGTGPQIPKDQNRGARLLEGSANHAMAGLNRIVVGSVSH